MKKLLLGCLLLAALTSPAVAQCSYRSKANECNGISGMADGLSGCSVETSDAWYDIKINDYGRSSIKKVCEKYPSEGYCGCSDYGIY